MLLGAGVVITLTPLIVGTLFAHRALDINPVIVCGAGARYYRRRRRDGLLRSRRKSNAGAWCRSTLCDCQRSFLRYSDQLSLV